MFTDRRRAINTADPDEDRVSGFYPKESAIFVIRNHIYRRIISKIWIAYYECKVGVNTGHGTVDRIDANIETVKVYNAKLIGDGVEIEPIKRKG